MKNKLPIFFISSLMISAISIGVFAQETSGKITVRVGGFLVKEGLLSVALYDSSVTRIQSENIPLAVQVKTVPVDAYDLTVVFDSIPVGRYAIEVFHDINSNGSFEYNREDYAFSNNARVHFGPVTFSQAAFSFDGDELHLNLSLENEKNGRSSNHYSNSIAFAPIISYAPETSLLLGANVIKLFKFKGADSLTRTSFMDVLAAFSLRKQFILEQNYTLFSNREKYMFIGFTGLMYFPQYYYGVGNALPASNKELIKYNLFRFEHLALRNIYKKMFVGVGYRYVTMFNMKSAPGGELASSKVPGYKGAVVSGIQVAFSSDNRDNIYNTYKGHLLRIKATFNSKMIGSGYTFRSYEFDGRKFVKLFKDRSDVLAMQAYGYFSFGNVPWSEMGALGSDMIMRGYYSGRYRDKNYTAVQAEYRHPFNKMYGVVFFVGTGEVAHKVSGFSLSGLKPNAGAGFRMTIDRKEKLNLRLDMGFGKNTSNLYFSVAEAF